TITLPVQAPELSPWLLFRGRRLRFRFFVFFTLSGVPHPAKSAFSVLNLIELKKLVLLLSPCVSARRLKQLPELTCSGQCPNHLG
ncbi:hypothetical protein, partial [Nocardiopsis nanhaiensis]